FFMHQLPGGLQYGGPYLLPLPLFAFCYSHVFDVRMCRYANVQMDLREHLAAFHLHICISAHLHINLSLHKKPNTVSKSNAFIRFNKYFLANRAFFFRPINIFSLEVWKKLGFSIFLSSF